MYTIEGEVQLPVHLFYQVIKSCILSREFAKWKNNQCIKSNTYYLIVYKTT